MAQETLLAGRYRLLERHAVGGMASLWRALDEWTGAVVAVKRLHPFVATDRNARRRLLKEAAALRALDHHAIVRPRDVVDDPGDPALIMDFAEGVSLKDRLTAGPLPAPEAVGIISTVADALATAHRAGIVHRDIKPANILVQDDGSVHLVDFGIATEPAIEDALTAPGTVVGTVRYAPPERLAGQPATPEADVWALGAVLHEMVTGRPMPDGASGLEEITQSLASVIRQATSPDPAARYPDAGAFRDALAGATGPADEFAETVVVPVAGTVIGEPQPGEPQRLEAGPAVGPGAGPAVGSITRERWSPVDRAAAVFLAVVAISGLLAAGAIGLSSVGGGNSPASPVVPAVSGPAVVEPTVAPDEDEEADDEPGNRGKGSDKGNGKGKGNGD